MVQQNQLKFVAYTYLFKFDFCKNRFKSIFHVANYHKGDIYLETPNQKKKHQFLMLTNCVAVLNALFD